MEYRFSEEVKTEPLGAGLGLGLEGIHSTLRMHKDPFSEILGALRAQRDWVRHVQSDLGGTYKGGLGDRYSFIRVTVPECLPERLEIISYANEYAFLYDGKFTPYVLVYIWI